MHKRDGDGDWGSGQGPCSSQGSSSCGKALDSPWLHSVEGQRLFRKMGTGKVLSDPQCMQNPKFTLQLSEVDGVTSILHVGLGKTHPEPSTRCLCLCRVPLSQLRTISCGEQRRALCQQGQARGHQGAASGALPLHCRAKLSSDQTSVKGEGLYEHLNVSGFSTYCLVCEALQLSSSHFKCEQDSDC